MRNIEKHAKNKVRQKRIKNIYNCLVLGALLFNEIKFFMASFKVKI